MATDGSDAGARGAGTAEEGSPPVPGAAPVADAPADEEEADSEAAIADIVQ